jgi:hypothetical protein
VANIKHTADQRNSFIAVQLGWTMDAFDYFIVVLVYGDIAETFHVSKTEVAFLTTATLMMRPVAALIFGLWADRVGRRIPLMVDVAFYSIVGFLCAFAPNFTVLIVLRLLYGIGMGGEWGLGAALAMEKVPAERRGFFSGPAPGGLLVRLPVGEPGLASRDRQPRTILALAIRAEHRSRVDHAADPHQSPGIGSVAGHPGPQARHPNADPRRRGPRRCDHSPIRLSGATYDRLQLDESWHSGRLSDIPVVDSRKRRRVIQ